MKTKKKVLAFLTSDVWEGGDWWVDVEDDVARNACRRLEDQRRQAAETVIAEIAEDQACATGVGLTFYQKSCALLREFALGDGDWRNRAAKELLRDAAMSVGPSLKFQFGEFEKKGFSLRDAVEFAMLTTDAAAPDEDRERWAIIQQDRLERKYFKLS